MSKMNIKCLGPDANGNNAYRAIWGQGFGKAATFINEKDSLIFKGGDPENPRTAEAGKTIAELLKGKGEIKITFPEEVGPKFIAQG